MITREDYIQAVANGLGETVRDEEIARRITLITPIPDQIGILMDKDTKPEKFAKQQALRARIMAEVDALIASFNVEEDKI